MTTADYNQKGVNYVDYVQNGGTFPSGHLNSEGNLWLLLFQDAITKASHTQNTEEKLILSQIGGCLHHLSTFLFQVDRIVKYIDILKSIPSKEVNIDFPVCITKIGGGNALIDDLLVAPAMVRIGVAHLEYDFLQLLLTGVATLERLATFVSSALVGKEKNFFNLAKAIAASNDPRAHETIQIINEITPKISGILVSDSNNKSLRNKIAHLQSVPELTDRSMTFFLLPNDRILRFDYELAGFPIIKTAHQISGALPFLIAAVCRLMFVRDASGNEINSRIDCVRPEEKWFLPEWDNPTVHYNKFIDHTGTGPLVSSLKPILNGIELSASHLRPDVFDYTDFYLTTKK